MRPARRRCAARSLKSVAHSASPAPAGAPPKPCSRWLWPTPPRSTAHFSYSLFPISYSAMRRLLSFLVSAVLLGFAAHVDAIVYVAADFQTLVSEAHTIVL